MHGASECRFISRDALQFSPLLASVDLVSVESSSYLAFASTSNLICWLSSSLVGYSSFLSSSFIFSFVSELDLSSVLSFSVEFSSVLAFVVELSTVTSSYDEESLSVSLEAVSSFLSSYSESFCVSSSLFSTSDYFCVSSF